MEPNFLAIILAGVAAWVIGAVWYNVLGKAWQNELGFSDEYLAKGNMVVKFGLSLVCMILMCFALNFIIMAHPAGEMSIAHGAFHGALAGFFYCAMSMGINYLYQQRSIKLWLIDALYQIAMLAAGGAVLGYFAS